MMSNTDFGNISFDLPKNQSNVIKVIGVGGGGSNAINHMFQQGIKGVDFVICNTDSQALQNSSIPNKIQLGVSLTEGLGAGANPEVGEQAAIESVEELKKMLDTNTKMAFITAGMGGGTGTGAAPVIAKLAKDLDILTVGIVTMPFQFEGRMRNEQAQKGIENLRQHVDSLIVINNNKLREVYGNLGFKAGFSKADEVLATASRGIAEVITHHYTQNIDLRDAKTVLSNSGTAIMGSATATGTSRAQEAISQALDSPLLNDNKIKGAKNVLLLIVSGSEEITLDEIGEINDHIQQEAGNSANIIMGVGEDESLGDAIGVTVIATGFNVDQQHEIVNVEAKKIIHTLEDEQKAMQDLSPKSSGSNLNTLAFANEVKKEEPKPQVEPVIKHTLEEETDKKQDDFIVTTNEVKNTNVVYDEITADIDTEEFVIIEANQNEAAIEENTFEAETQEEQFTLSFDMPIEEPKENVIHFSLTEEAKEVEVNAPEVIEPIAVKEDNEIRYTLEDVEEEQVAAKVVQKTKPADAFTYADVVFEKKVVETEESAAATSITDEDPFNSPIRDLKKGTEERRKRLKDFNYKFNNSINSKIDEIEKEPAYKRMGVDLNPQPTISNASRLSIGKDANDDLQIRSNNSFLHDNVD